MEGRLLSEAEKRDLQTRAAYYRGRFHAAVAEAGQAAAAIHNRMLEILSDKHSVYTAHSRILLQQSDTHLLALTQAMVSADTELEQLTKLTG